MKLKWEGHLPQLRMRESRSMRQLASGPGSFGNPWNTPVRAVEVPSCCVTTAASAIAPCGDVAYRVISHLTTGRMPSSNPRLGAISLKQLTAPTTAPVGLRRSAYTIRALLGCAWAMQYPLFVQSASWPGMSCKVRHGTFYSWMTVCALRTYHRLSACRIFGRWILDSAYKLFIRCIASSVCSSMLSRYQYCGN